MTSTRKPPPLPGRKFLIFGGLIALAVAVFGVLFAPTFFDFNVPGMKDDARVSGITGVRQAALLAAGGILAAATLLQTVERDRFTRDKYNADIENAKEQIEDLRAQRTVEQARYGDQRELDQERLTEQRAFDTEKELRGRFVAAAELLTGDKPVMRTAGAYAMAALADEWERTRNRFERQVCIDVLCAYLRSPWDPQADGSDEEALVRSTIVNIIGGHLRPAAAVNWQQATFDLTRARIAFDSDLSSIEIQADTFLNFANVEFAGGYTNFREAKFAGGIANFRSAEFIGGTIDFVTANFTAGSVRFFGAKFTGSTINFTIAQFTGSTIDFRSAEFTGGTIIFSTANFASGTTSFRDAKFSGGTIHFIHSEATGGTIDFRYSEITGGTIDFRDSEILSGTVNLGRMKFIGGEVDFSGVTGQRPGRLDFSTPSAWDMPPRVPWPEEEPVPDWVEPKKWPPEVSHQPPQVSS